MTFTIADRLTIARIAAIPLILGLVFVPMGWAGWAALALYVGAALTDWLDGMAARQWGGSRFGRIMDPIADKALVGTLLLALPAAARLPGWAVPAALIILVRELLVSGLRETLASEGRELPVTRLAKLKTVVQMLALAVLLVPVDQGLDAIGGLMLWLAAGLTVQTGWGYVKTALAATEPEAH